MDNLYIYKKIDELIRNSNKILDVDVFDCMCPLSLSYIGINLLDGSGFKTIFEEVKDKLNARIEVKYAPKTKYDVQEGAYRFMAGHSTCEHTPFNALKKYAYEKGKDYSQILRAGSILVRDYYLEKHSEIKE